MVYSPKKTKEGTSQIRRPPPKKQLRNHANQRPERQGQSGVEWKGLCRLAADFAFYKSLLADSLERRFYQVCGKICASLVRKAM